MTQPHPDGSVLADGPTPDGDLGWWMIVGSVPNVVPGADLRQHILGETCWCRPEYSQDGVLNHHPFDGRGGTVH